MTNTNDRALKILSTALEMEEKGRAFYQKAAKECKNELGKEMFSSLMSDEVVHAGRIKNIFSSLQAGRGWNEEWKSLHGSSKNMSKFFTDFAKRNGTNIKADSSDIKALEVGIDLEQKSINYYQENLKTAVDAIEKAFLEKMILEEKYHHKLLNDTKLYLSNPTAWFNEQEHSGFDGA